MGTLVFQATLGGAVNIIGPNIAGTVNFTLPSADGTSGQAISTNGSGVLSFGTLAVTAGGTGVTTSTGTGNVVLSTSPTLVTPLLGTPTSGVLTNCTGLPNAGLVNSSITIGGTAIALGASSNTLANDITVYGVTVGRGAGAVSTNTAVGASALITNTTGARNTAFGNFTLATHTTATDNTALGYGALNALQTSASFNTAIGSYSLVNQTTGTNNTAVGYYSGQQLQTGSNNTAIGRSALENNLSASNNTAVGYQAGYTATGAGNQLFGYLSGSAITTGAKNVIIGSYTGSAAPISATGSNFVVLSDGDGNIVASSKTAQTFALQGGTLSSGTGIAFPATQSASSDANTLDDYEEGTWTPNVGGTATYTRQQGGYTKIGRVVTVRFDLEILLIGTGSSQAISGLPFGVGSEATSQGNGATGYFSTLATNVIGLTCVAVAGTSAIYFNSIAAAGTTATLNPTILGNSARVSGTITYFI